MMIHPSLGSELQLLLWRSRGSLNNFSKLGRIRSGRQYLNWLIDVRKYLLDSSYKPSIHSILIKILILLCFTNNILFHGAKIFPMNFLPYFLVRKVFLYFFSHSFLCFFFYIYISVVYVGQLAKTYNNIMLFNIIFFVI